MTDQRHRQLQAMLLTAIDKALDAPVKKPVDSYEDTESQNMPRKHVLMARSNGRGDPKNKPGRRNALGIMKQEATPSNYGTNTMTNDFEYDPNAIVKHAEKMLMAGDGADLDQVEKLLDQAIEGYSDLLKGKGKTHPKAPTPPSEADPEDEFDHGADEENESDAKKVYEDAEADAEMEKALDTLDADMDHMLKIAKYEEGSGAHDLRSAASLSDVEADVDRVAKLGGIQPVRYPREETVAFLQHNRDSQQPVIHTSEFGQASRQTGVYPATAAPPAPSFDDRVHQIMARDGVSKFGALSRARLEYPDEYAVWQLGDAAAPDESQDAYRTVYNDPTNKRALIEAEIRKGHHPHIAEQRVAEMYGGLDSASIAKANDVAAEWREAAQDIVDRDGGSRVEALRKARFERPELFRELQGRN